MLRPRGRVTEGREGKRERVGKRREKYREKKGRCGRPDVNRGIRRKKDRVFLLSIFSRPQSSPAFLTGHCVFFSAGLDGF